jgi:hypothetical protein
MSHADGFARKKSSGHEIEISIGFRFKRVNQQESRCQTLYPIRVPPKRKYVNPLGSLSRTARPSSGHPGIAVAAFCDGGVRKLKDDMDKTLFVRLCRPGSGVILNPKDLGF